MHPFTRIATLVGLTLLCQLGQGSDTKPRGFAGCKEGITIEKGPTNELSNEQRQELDHFLELAETFAAISVRVDVREQYKQPVREKITRVPGYIDEVDLITSIDPLLRELEELNDFEVVGPNVDKYGILINFYCKCNLESINVLVKSGFVKRVEVKRSECIKECSCIPIEGLGIAPIGTT